MCTCERCGHGEAVTMSYFNTDLLCLSCIEVERAHPDFEKARTAEESAVRAGNFNFPGIGWPGSP